MQHASLVVSHLHKDVEVGQMLQTIYSYRLVFPGPAFLVNLVKINAFMRTAAIYLVIHGNSLMEPAPTLFLTILCCYWKSLPAIWMLP